jgi:septal ring factor EnvC (AmiA/AmiB activator)
MRQTIIRIYPKTILSFLRLICVILFIYALTFAQENIESSRRELEKTQEKLRAVQSKIDDLGKEEKGVLKRIEAYDEKIVLSKKYIQDLTKAQKLKQNEINIVSGQIRTTQSQIIARQIDLEKMLVNYYKEQRIYPIEVLLSNKSMADVYKKSVYLRVIAQDRKRMIKEFSGFKQNLEFQQKKLITANLQLAQYKQQREQERNNLNNLQGVENKILGKVRNEKTQNLTMEEELKAAAAKLEKLITELETRRRERKLAPDTHYLEIMKGKLPWPYYGEVVARFGTKEDPKYNTMIKNTGIDIKTPNTAGIKAIAKGRVVYADRFMGYGNMIILDHSDGFYSLYSNLSEMDCSVGTNVEQADIIGNSKDILHFELRSEGKPVDPQLWLSR